VEKLKSQRL